MEKVTRKTRHTSRAQQRIARPDDPRALRSSEALRKAMLELVEERPFDQITVRDVTVLAGVSYPVFFRRYANKEELLEDIAADQVRSLISLSMPMFNADLQQESLTALCEYVERHRPLWTRLLNGGAAPAMREEFKRIAAEIGKGMENTHERINSWLPVDLGADFVVNAMFGILAWWLRQAEDYPLQNVVKLLDALIIRPTLQPTDVKLL